MFEETPGKVVPSNNGCVVPKQILGQRDGPTDVLPTDEPNGKRRSGDFPCEKWWFPHEKYGDFP